MALSRDPAKAPGVPGPGTRDPGPGTLSIRVAPSQSRIAQDTDEGPGWRGLRVNIEPWRLVPASPDRSQGATTNDA